jgi:predicted permease
VKLVLKLLRRRVNESAIEEDLEAHVAERTDELIDRGLSPEEARTRARREFGNLTLLKEKSRDEWSMGLLGQWGNDLRFAIRSLRRNPGFALTVVMTLALGIGANGGIFNLLYAVVVRALPVPNAEQLRIVRPVVDGDSGEPIFSYPVFTEMLRTVGAKASLAGYSSVMRAGVGGQEAGQQAAVQLVTGTFFQTLGVSAELGRLLNPSDDLTTGDYHAVLSDRYWSSNFGRDVSVIGHRATLNGAAVVIVGVAAPGFFGIEPGRLPDYWLPVSSQRDVRYLMNFWDSNGDSSKPFLLQLQIRWLGLVTRIPDLASEPYVLTALNQVFGRDMQREAKQQDPSARARLLRIRVTLYEGAKGLGGLRQRFAEPLQVLMCAVGLVLFIASVNLASLALARVVARNKEIAIRCSVGAGRGRILSHLTAETAVLTVSGAFLSIPIALAGSRVLLRWASTGNPVPLDVSFGLPLLVFIMGAAMTVGLIFGLLPVVQALGISLASTLKANASSLKGIRMPWGRTLIAAQVTFSFVLLAGAVLFVRTLMNYSQIGLGYAPQQVLSVRIDPLGARYETKQLRALYHRLLDRVGSIPGVQSVAIGTCELAEGCQRIDGIQIPGGPRGEMDIQENNVSPGYFQTLGMGLIEGRAFDWNDRGAAPILAVVNKTAARQYFGGTKAIGQYYGSGGDNRRYQIIGVISDARVNNVHEPAKPMAYYSLIQDPTFASSLEVLTRSDPAAIASSIRAGIRSVDPNLPVTDVLPLTRIVDDNLLRERLLARLASVFAVLALALACLGVYGVLSYSIARRTPEIGIRLALGAEPESVRWMILREALLVIAGGLVAGVPASIALIQIVQKLLFGLTPADPASLTLSVVGLLAAGTAAALVPAWRASRLDPIIALRYE